MPNLNLEPRQLKMIIYCLMEIKEQYIDEHGLALFDDSWTLNEFTETLDELENLEGD